MFFNDKLKKEEDFKYYYLYTVIHIYQHLYSLINPFPTVYYFQRPKARANKVSNENVVRLYLVHALENNSAKVAEHSESIDINQVLSISIDTIMFSV